MRLGIGHPGVKAEVIDYVLRKPPVEQREAIEKSIAQSLGALDLLLAGEMDKALAKVHAQPPRPKPPKAPTPPTPPTPAPDAAPSLPAATTTPDAPKEPT